MQTNKEFLDAIGIRPEDDFLAIAVRRAAAWQLGKSVVDLELTTVGEPDFVLPWDGKQFGYLLEKELSITIPFGDAKFQKTSLSIPHDWFRGPAIKMPMDQWTKIAIEQFLQPVREKIVRPEHWTPLEPEEQEKNETFREKVCFMFYSVLFFFFPLTLVILSIPGLFLKDWANNISKPCLFLLVLYPCIIYLYFYCSACFFGNKKTSCKNGDAAELPFSQLLGTLTFHNTQLQFGDDEMVQGNLEILPGDYRFFLIRPTKESSPFYAVLTTDSEPPCFEELMDMSLNALDNKLPENVQKLEIVIDSGLIAISELAEPFTASITESKWIPGQSRQTVALIRQRPDGTVCGLKLYPSYGDGDYRIFVRRTPKSCMIAIELTAPDEDDQPV
jgi:hypothetical protein